MFSFQHSECIISRENSQSVLWQVRAGGDLSNLSSSKWLQSPDYKYSMSLPFRMEIIPDTEEGGYTARFPDLPGYLTCAETIEDPTASAQDAKKPAHRSY